ncbi:putative odorant receptor 83c [Anopheles maculipalpis]|uniref:putative odorant receptor 83c n=1 Tax=Anopheles maculipalpis TaxID=1496333 RepID=UPI002158F170|nr:putative odorant receptor 83c [Anopheles maculipalpis]
MDAAKKFHQYERYLRTLCNVLGFDVVSKGWKKSFRTYVTIFLCGQYFLWMVWSIIIASDTFELLKSLSFIGFFFQCSSKMYYTIANAAHYGNNFGGLQETIYNAHMDGTVEQKTVIERVISVILLATKATTVLYTSSLFIFSLYPAYMYFVMNVKVTIFPLYIPGINIYSAYGYGITNSLHMLIAVYGLLGALTSDTAFMLFVMHFISYGELFRIECEQFARDLSDFGEQWERHTPQYKAFCYDRMRALYQYHQKVIEYLSSLQECYHSICVFQVASCSFSVMFNLFLALTTDWYATYSFIVISWFQLFVFSLLGTVMQIMNDRLNIYIANLPWYLLPNEEQQRYNFMLGRSQLPAEMVIRSVGPMNMETFTDIMQKIYSAFTMMYSFLVDLG